MENSTQLPEKIRLNLKKYQKHRHLTCLECGYVGLMGVNNSITSTIIFWGFIVFLAVFLAFMGVHFYLILITVFFIPIFKKIFFGDKVFCPNCEKDLIIK